MYDRSVYGVGGMLGDTGGFIDVMIILGHIMVGLFKSTLFYTSILKNVYQVEDYDDIFKDYNRVTTDLGDKDGKRRFSGEFDNNGGDLAGNLIDNKNKKKKKNLDDIKADQMRKKVA